MPEATITSSSNFLIGLGDSDAFLTGESVQEEEVHYHAGEEKWGFRMTGGAEFKMPFVVFHVAEGGLAAEAEIKLGDIILEINGVDTNNLTLAEWRKIAEEATESIEILAKKMEDENEVDSHSDEKKVVLKLPFKMEDLKPPVLTDVHPKAEKKVWHPVMWNHVSPIVPEGPDLNTEPPHSRIIRNIRRFFKETEDKPELRQKHIEDMLLSLPGASKID